MKQLVTGRRECRLHTATIVDWPAMQYRGLDDDLSRGPVPTLEFEKKLIRTIAAYKINLYSPYFENTAAYASNPLIAPPGGALARPKRRPWQPTRGSTTSPSCPSRSPSATCTTC